MFPFVTYFKTVAEQHPDIQHQDGDDRQKRFFRATGTALIEELLTGQTYFTGSHGLMVIDNESGRMVDNQFDTRYDQPFYTILVVGKFSRDNADEIEQVKAENKRIAFSILSKMFSDAQQGINGLGRFQLESVTYFSLGPLAQNYYLFGVNFSLLQSPEFCQDISAFDFNLNL